MKAPHLSRMLKSKLRNKGYFRRYYFKGLQWAFLLLGIFLVFQADAEEPSPASSSQISLGEAVHLGLTRNPNLLAARQGVEEAHLGVKQAYGAFLPVLDISQAAIRSDNPVTAFASKLNQGGFRQQDFALDALNNPDAVTDHMTSVTLKVPLFNGGAEYAGLAVAREGRNKAERMTEEGEEELTFQIIQAFYQAILAREALEVTKEAVKTSEASLGIIQQRFEQGLVVKSDLLGAKVRLSTLKESEARAENQALLALMGVNLLLGDPSGTFIPDGALLYMACPAVSKDKLTGIAFESRQELLSLQVEEKQAAQEIALARSAFLPHLNGQAAYEYHGVNPFSDGADNTTLSLGLSLNVFNGTRDHQALGMAKAKAQRLDYQIAALRDRIAFEVAQATSDLAEAEKRVEISAETAEQAAETASLVTSQYKEGTATLVELQQAELGVSQARMMSLKAGYDHLIAQARVCRAIGQSRKNLGKLADTAPESRDSGTAPKSK